MLLVLALTGLGAGIGITALGPGGVLATIGLFLCTGLSPAVAGPTDTGSATRSATRTRPRPPRRSQRRRSRVLLVYFSRAGENYNYGDRIDLEVGYDTVLLASPIWNLRPPMIMQYAAACAGASIGAGLAMRGEKVRGDGPSAVADWLDRVGLTTT